MSRKPQGNKAQAFVPMKDPKSDRTYTPTDASELTYMRSRGWAPVPQKKADTSEGDAPSGGSSSGSSSSS